MKPDEYCEKKLNDSGSSFRYAVRGLPPPARRALTAIYAFCREVDDAVDRIQEPSVAQRTLLWWMEEVDRLYRGHPTHPITQALQAPLATYQWPEAHFQALLKGMWMDSQHAQPATWSALQDYCYHVAGVVGLLSAPVFGASEASETFAIRLGECLQLINILRDIGEDERRNRRYLPQEDEVSFGVVPSDWSEKRPSPALVKLFQFEADRARQCFQDALAALPASQRRHHVASFIMAHTYLALLDEMELDGFTVLDRKYHLPRWRKLWIALKVKLRFWIRG